MSEQKITFLTRDIARQAREDQSYGYIFPLSMTGGVFARVKIPNLNDRAFLDQLPEAAQRIIGESLLEAANDARAKKGQTTTDNAPRTTREVMSKLKIAASDQEEAANELCCRCFLEPRVVMTESEIDPKDPGVIVVTDIHLEDRITFLAIGLAGEGEAARRLRLFRQSMADAPHQPGNQKASTT